MDDSQYIKIQTRIFDHQRIHKMSGIATIYAAHLEDSEGCGTLELSLHRTKAGAEAAFIAMFFAEHYDLDGEDDDAGRPYREYSADELSEFLEEELSHTGGVREEELRP